MLKQKLKIIQLKCPGCPCYLKLGPMQQLAPEIALPPHMAYCTISQC
uniref:Uncharacterized protein n=1 Tax=Rhizophora mucronata TaxID=61149 RepID=A0A2P2PX29_RHIMU